MRGEVQLIDFEPESPAHSAPVYQRVYDFEGEAAAQEEEEEVLVPPTPEELADQQRILRSYTETPMYQEARKRSVFRLEPCSIAQEDFHPPSWSFSSHGSSLRVTKLGDTLVAHGDFKPLGKVRFHPKYPNLFLMMGYRALKDFVEFGESLSLSEGVPEASFSVRGLTNGRMAETLKMFGFDVSDINPRKQGPHRLKDKDRAHVVATLSAIKAAIERFEQQETRPSREVPLKRPLLQVLTARAFREIER